ncbi:MAG: MBL fold metallo-hydrolase [Proteobacteria bacterium]|nr:MBL fold metallo-hydrolase [Pseudomonadota bacterium]
MSSKTRCLATPGHAATLTAGPVRLFDARAHAAGASRRFCARARDVSLVLAASLGLVVGCGDDGQGGPAGRQGEQGLPGPKGPNGDLDSSLSTWEKAVAGIGGQTALNDLTGFTIQANGVRSLRGQGFRYDLAAEDVDRFETVTSVDLNNETIRVDWSRTILPLGGKSLQYSEIINGNLGYVDGDDSAFGMVASTTDMPSGRWAAVRKQVALTNPHVLLHMVNGDPNLARSTGTVLHNGAVYELLEVDGDVYPITLYVNAKSGRIAKLRTMENDHLHRDIPIEVHFLDWRSNPGTGADFPLRVSLTVNGHIWHWEKRTTITQNPSFTNEFALPGGSSPTHDPAAAAWGQKSHQFVQGLASFGIPHNAQQLVVDSSSPLEPGVHFLGGSSHNSMAVEQENGVVIIEPSLYPERGEAILAWVETEIGKPVTHVILTHHHYDHAGGFRAFVAAGASVVVGEPSAALFAALADAPSTINPDAQQSNPQEATIIAVPVGGTHVIAGTATFPDVTAIHVTSGHAADMVMVHVDRAGGYIFQSDLFNPDAGGNGSALSPAHASELLNAINGHGLNVPGATLVGGHGSFAPLIQLEDFVLP